VPVYLTGEMDAREAAMAVEWLGPSYAIPCHHDDPSLREIVQFRDLLSQACLIDGDAPRPVLLSPGERMVLHEGNTRAYRP
jgi:L-ascorbate metabolism protein UlaG (beta-lactamase superfamily)